MTRIIRIGTRRSKLSLWQANHIAKLIRVHHSDVRIELKPYQTRGDQNQETPLPAIGGKGLFTQALEIALSEGEIDCAVHSLKDLPTDESADIVIGAIPQRGDHRDVLVSPAPVTLDQLPAGARIGSGSLRRRAQLLRLRQDLRLLGIRGNVPTRIDKLMAPGSPYDAIVLAAAGLQRLGLTDYICETFDMERMISAAGQGALAVQCRAEQRSFFAPLNDRATLLAVSAERAFLASLDAGCSLPVAAYSHIDGETLHFLGRVTAEDGKRHIDVKLNAPLSSENSDIESARQLGRQAAKQALENGAAAILNAIQAAKSSGKNG